MPTRPNPLLEAIDQDAYQWLGVNAPYYLTAIERSIELGVSPENIGRTISVNVGPDRQQLAKRCTQAARHMQRMTD